MRTATTMRLYSSFAAFAFLLFLFFIPQAVADLKSDKQALLNFAAKVPHKRKLNWSASTQVCTSWVGINCTVDGSRVLAIHLPASGLRGPIPPNTLGKLDALMLLSLRSNQLSGSLPSDVLSLPSLRYIFLQHNNFSGHMPTSLPPQLSFLDLSFNFLAGNIPTTILNLTHLAGLNLQSNSLSGLIPDSNLPRLRYLNLSHNHLNGSIPSAFQKFPASSFEGNLMLCGPPLSQCPVSPSTSPSPSHIPPPPTVSKNPSKGSNRKLSTGAIIAITAAGLALLFFILLIAGICFFKKKCSKHSIRLKGKGVRSDKPKEDFGSGVQEAEKNKLVFFDGPSYNFDLEDLLRASAEVLGKGSCGTTYKAILEEGTIVVVKRLKEMVAGKREFENQMEIVGRLGQHPNVVPLRAYYYSKDEKLLVYDYITAGSLSNLLHGSKCSGSTAPDWDSRVKISLGAAKGIAHIHSAGAGKFMHGNIKSSNILLSQDRHGYISDFGLTPLISYPTVPSRSAGYRAPEVIETRKFTQKSDVYSFGVLLLEMLTGKSPVQAPGHEEVVDLPRWVQSVVREEWTAEVFDVELMRCPNNEEEMVQMLQIAMTCVGRLPDTRPTMQEVVRMIEDIWPSDSENRPSSDDSKSKGSNTQTP